MMTASLLIPIIAQNTYFTYSPSIITIAGSSNCILCRGTQNLQRSKIFIYLQAVSTKYEVHLED